MFLLLLETKKRSTMVGRFYYVYAECQSVRSVWQSHA